MKHPLVPGLRMSLCPVQCFIVCMFFMHAVAGIHADPVIAWVHPAGVRSGEPTLVTVAGQGLKGASGLLWSGGTMQAELVSFTGAGGALTRVQEEDLREVLVLLNRRASAGYRDPPPVIPETIASLPELENAGARTRGELERIFKKYIDRETRPKSPMNELAVFKVRVAPETGTVSGGLRIICGSAVSPPVPFGSDIHPEVCEPDRFALDPVPGLLPESRAPGSPSVPLSVPFVYNGQIFPGETDSVWLHADDAVVLDVEVKARALVPFIADAVPGWFQAVLELRDAQGKTLAVVDDTGRNPDPAYMLSLPAAGDYEIRLRDSIYRGRHDFVYRLKVVQAAAFPGAGLRSAESSGWAGNGKVTSTVHGTLKSPGAVDLYPLKLTAGEVLSVALRADPEDSPLDAVAGLYSPDRMRAVLSDDVEDPARGLSTHHSDAAFMFVVPVTGTWTVAVTDAQGRGGSLYGYSLTAGPPRPDFFVMTESSAVNLAPLAGTPGTRSAPVVFAAVRRDGFTGKIEIVPENLPRGFSLSGALIPEGKDSVTAVLKYSGPPPGKPVRMSFTARAVTGSVMAAKPVTPCDKKMQAFAWLHLVPSGDFYAGFLK